MLHAEILSLESSIALDAHDTKLVVERELTESNLGYAGPVGFEPTIFGSLRNERRSPMSYPGCPRQPRS